MLRAERIARRMAQLQEQQQQQAQQQQQQHAVAQRATVVVDDGCDVTSARTGRKSKKGRAAGKNSDRVYLPIVTTVAMPCNSSPAVPQPVLRASVCDENEPVDVL